MMIRRWWPELASFLVVQSFSVICCAQRSVVVTGPTARTTGSFGEGVGVVWGAQQLGVPGLAPPGGGLDPGGAALQFRGRVGNVGWGLGIVADQGSSQSLTSQSPSIVMPNGGMGFFSNTIQTPFVTGVVPLVGLGGISPVRERWMRLQYERAMAAAEQQTGQQTGDLNNDVDDPNSDELPPPVPQPPGQRPPDDPPLVLGKP